MEQNFLRTDWKDFLPKPVYDERPEYEEFYMRAWELARDHVREIEGMPQNPYMDEAFCDTQVWIWDTCFMTLFCKFAREVFPGVETLNNFYQVLHEGKQLPSIVPSENEPDWTCATPGVPFPIQVHLADNPPLFAWAEYENALMCADKEYLSNLLNERKILQKHYEWVEELKYSLKIPGVTNITHLKHKERGYTWEGGCSGMDNTPRGRVRIPSEERPNNPNMLWLDAICQQALSAKMIAKLFTLLGDMKNASEWEGKYQEKKDLVNTYYWDKEDKFYYDIDENDGHFYKVQTMASYWALTAGIASQEQAKEMLALLFDENLFGGRVPFVTLARNDAEFQHDGQYWRGSVWLPTAYATLKGISQYGFHKEARELSLRLLEHMYHTYKQYTPHTIWECYSPCAYEPGRQTDNEEIVRPNFCGWSALGPIAIYLEYVLGFHTINAFEKVIEWAKPEETTGKIGVKNLRFGGIVTNIVAEGNDCIVTSNKPYTLKINGKIFDIVVGENKISIA